MHVHTLYTAHSTALCLYQQMARSLYVVAHGGDNTVPVLCSVDVHTLAGLVPCMQVVLWLAFFQDKGRTHLLPF